MKDILTCLTTNSNPFALDSTKLLPMKIVQEATNTANTNNSNASQDL